MLVKILYLKIVLLGNWKSLLKKFFIYSGAEIVVIHIWYTHEQIISLLNQINGVLFSAGPRRPLKYDEP